jgi:hypothetical protein
MKIFLPNGSTHEVPPTELPEEAPKPYDFMEEGRQFAAQCWCDEETKHIPMDTRIAEACAKRIASWMQTAAEGYRGADFYRGIIEQCGAAIGIEAFTSDDGSVQEDVLALKLPELVMKLVLDNRPQPDPLPQVEGTAQ